MYLQPDEVKSLVLRLQAKFSGAELVCEVVNAVWLRKWLKWIINTKLQRESHLGPEATFNFGLKDSQDFERWNEGIEFLGDWSYLDEAEKKLGVLRLFRHIDFVRRTQWTVHYKLH